MAQDPAVYVVQKGPRKRVPFFADFLEKILPSHRPERGGTIRVLDNKSTESVYRDLDIDPEALIHWSIAQDLPVGSRKHTRGRSASVNYRRANLASIASRPKLSRTIRQPTAPLRRAKTLSAAETVLTPTDSPSSDATAPSDADRIAKLIKEEKQSRRDYDDAKRKKEEEMERLALEKAQSRLDKIERLKSRQKQQHQPGKWIRGRGYWSSVAKPGLSPITQSSASYENIPSTLGSIKVPVAAIASAVALVPAQVSNRQGKANPSNSSCVGNGNALIRRLSQRHPSIDTIIYTPAPRRLSQHVAFAEPAPKSRHDEKSEADTLKSKPMPGGRHFLWGRRRWVTYRVGQIVDEATATPLSTMREPSAHSPDLTLACQTDHSTGLVIPNYHIGPIHMKREREARRLSEETQAPSHPAGSNAQVHTAREEGSPVLRQVRSRTQEQHPYGQDGAPVTVILSQSRSNSNTTRHSGPQEPVTSPVAGERITSDKLMSHGPITHPHSTQCSESQALDAMEGWRRVPSTPVKLGHEEKTPKPPRAFLSERKSEIIETIQPRPETARPYFACIPTTITTGCAVNLLICPISQALLDPIDDIRNVCIGPVSPGSGNVQSGVHNVSVSLPEANPVSLPATAMKGRLKAAQYHLTPSHDAQTAPAPRRCAKPGHEDESAFGRRTARNADGTIGLKITQKRTAAALAPKSPPPPSRAPPPVPMDAAQRSTTIQEAARAAMLRSRSLEAAGAPGIGIKKRQQQRPDPGRFKTIQRHSAADADNTDAPSRPAPAPAPLAPVSKRDAVDTIRVVGSFAATGIWAAAWAW